MEYFILKYAHILAFVYWLGGDLGTFFSSKYVIKTELGVEVRSLALKIMLACDQGPKMSMPIIFPLGLQMANTMGIVAVPSTLMLALWAMTVFWMANVMFLHLSNNVAVKAIMGTIDYWLRISVVIAVLAYAVVGLMDAQLIRAPYISYKMIIFAVLVVFGLMVRIALKDFMPAYVQLIKSGPTEAVNRTLTRSMKLAKPWVWGIWVGLFVNAAIGVHLVSTDVWLIGLTVITVLSPLPLLAVARSRYC